MASFAIFTLGCKVNQVESDSLQAMLLERGHELDEVNPHYAIINSCAVTHSAETKSRRIVNRIRKASPAVKIIFTGCGADALGDEQKIRLACDYYLCNADKRRVMDIVEERGAPDDAQRPSNDAVFEEYYHQTFPAMRSRIFIKIQDGCDNYCSYCIIPFLRGKVRSRAMHSIIDEINKAVAAGYQEIVLTGIHLGNYGKEQDFALRLQDVVAQILNTTSIARVRLGSIESPELSDSLLEQFDNPRLCTHLHLPLQSGCDATLARMNRGYSATSYAQLVCNILRRYPDMAITADVICGFPGETDEEFAATLQFVTALPLAGLHVFPYSLRKGTAAADMPDQLNEAVKKQRVAQLMHIASEQQLAYRKRLIGNVAKVLLEGQNDSYGYGYAENYQKVYLPGVHNSGEICMVRLVDLEQDGWLGELI